MKSGLSRIWIALGLVTLLVACAAEPRQVYSGARLSADKEVRITTESEKAYGAVAPGFDRKIYLVKINGQSLSDSKALIGGQMNPYPTEAYVLPGRNELDIKYVHLNSLAEGRLWFDGEAGKEYRVRSRIDGYKIFFWVEDVVAGKVVGGIRE
ncbi:MAG TPA: hypothetical protein PKE61_05410 [Burkholderiaceae bacterium]|nr:hypothetical protein [Burkholderiaceae bacterium]HNG80165.1 hypothetical protein [Burkholderiaceae bacterium]